ncbi:UspA [Alkaliphilus metalliredigens QYMF]|uniref:UspA n=1 Tax=Alkaliphilus metalliredigens (strain QYMF) TaxID=293826 RepID=A6TUD6_ALKMQ|nr:universal stress protein UspA [Alkaliphilus metalliredigens]ABR49804.1 UspA [Alkaliphilus metalliredigens QYMF]
MSKESNVMVCVTKQKTCERLIGAGAELQQEKGGELFIVHIAPRGWNILGNSEEGEALEYLFEISKSVGADMTVFRSSEISKTIIEFCKNKNIETIVLGESLETRPDNNMIVQLSQEVCGDVDIKIIPTYELNEI